MTAPAPAEVRRLRRISSRLMRALRSERPAHLRAVVAEVASDIEAMIAGHPVADELCADTLRSSAVAALELRPTDPAPPPEFEIDVELDQAPPVPLARPTGGP